MEILVPKCHVKGCKDKRLHEFESNGQFEYSCVNHLSSHDTFIPDFYPDSSGLEEILSKFLSIKNELNITKSKITNLSSKIIKEINHQVMCTLQKINKTIKKLEKNINLIFSKGKVFLGVVQNLKSIFYLPLATASPKLNHLKYIFQDLQNFSGFQQKVAKLGKFPEMMDSRLFSERVDISIKNKLIKKTLLYQKNKPVHMPEMNLKDFTNFQRPTFLRNMKLFQISLKKNLIVTSDINEKVYFWTLQMTKFHEYKHENTNKSLFALLLLKKSENLLLVYKKHGFSVLDLNSFEISCEVGLETSKVVVAKMSKDENFFAFGDYEGNLDVWGKKDSGFDKLFKDKAHEGTSHLNSMNCMNFSFSSSWIVSGGSDGKIFLRSLNKSKTCRIEKEEAHSGGVATVCFNFNDKFLISAGEEKTVKVWDVKDTFIVTKYSLKVSNRVKDIETSNKSNIFISGGQKQVFFWSFNENDMAKIEIKNKEQLVNISAVILDSPAFAKYLKNS
jgi:WD40 repeat protein